MQTVSKEKVRSDYMKRRNIIALIETSLILIFSGSMAACHVPLGLRWIVHRINPPEDLYKPIMVDAVPLWEAGFSKSYSLIPKYMDVYEIGLLSTNGSLFSKEDFSGKLKVEFLWKGKVLSECVITSIERGVYGTNSMTQLKAVSLMTFEIPLQAKYRENISVRLTVLEAFKNLKKYDDSLQLYIAVSPFD